MLLYELYIASVLVSKMHQQTKCSVMLQFYFFPNLNTKLAHTNTFASLICCIGTNIITHTTRELDFNAELESVLGRERERVSEIAKLDKYVHIDNNDEDNNGKSNKKNKFKWIFRCILFVLILVVVL